MRPHRIAAGILSIPAAEIDIGRYGTVRILYGIKSSAASQTYRHRVFTDGIPLEGERVRLTGILVGQRTHHLGTDLRYGMRPQRLQVGTTVELGQGRLCLQSVPRLGPAALGLLPELSTFGAWMHPQALLDLDNQQVRLYAERLSDATADQPTERSSPT